MHSDSGFPAPPRPEAVVRRPLDPIAVPVRAFFEHKLAGAGLLVAATAIALLWAASPWGEVYHHLQHLPIDLRVGDFALRKTAHHWVNDGVMALFFFVIGLELKREVMEGELSSVRRALLPAICAVGGMVVPAAIYAAINAGEPTLSGWGIPMATDIAFALGVLALLGDRVPPALKVLLTGIAVADDLGGILVIALFYTQGISAPALGLGLAGLAFAYGLNVLGVRHTLAYVVVGLGVWLCFVESGVHATIAAVALAFTIPARTRLDSRGMAEALDRLVQHYKSLPLPEGHGLLKPYEQAVLDQIDDVVEKGSAPAQRLEHALLPAVTFVVLPLFALVNAGVTLDVPLGDVVTSPAFLGVLVGLVVGKPLGIFAAAWLAVRLRLADLPDGLRLADVLPLGMVAGVGFTMSLFIGSLAFDDPAAVGAAKVGTLLASAIAALFAAGWLHSRPAR